jgi:hypothetical protein
MFKFTEFLNSAISSLKPSSVGEGFTIGEAHFTYLPSTAPSDPQPEKILAALSQERASGVLLDTSSAELRRWCDSQRISYITGDGYAAVYTADRAYAIRPLTTRRPNNGKLSRVAPSFRETRLVSPAGLKTLDMCLRLTRAELEVMTLGMVASKLAISQSALSKTLSALGGTGDLVDFASRARHISVESWLKAMRNPRTVRYLTPFFRVARRYKIAGSVSDAKEGVHWLSEVMEEFDHDVTPGPLEVAKTAGRISDKVTTLWCKDSSTAAAVKRRYRLVPAGVQEEALCIIGVPKHGLIEDAVVTAFAERGKFGLSATVKNSNVLRAIWDLGFGDTRLQAAQEEMVRGFIHEP